MSEGSKAKTPSLPELDEGELELFISKTLKAVIEGIAEADRYTRPVDADMTIEVEGDLDGSYRLKRPFEHEVSFGLPEEICFDVAVNVTRKSGKSGGLKIEVMRVGANASADVGREYSAASRVSFKIPVGQKIDV